MPANAPVSNNQDLPTPNALKLSTSINTTQGSHNSLQIHPQLPIATIRSVFSCAAPQLHLAPLRIPLPHNTQFSRIKAHTGRNDPTSSSNAKEIAQSNARHGRFGIASGEKRSGGPHVGASRFVFCFQRPAEPVWRKGIGVFAMQR